MSHPSLGAAGTSRSLLVILRCRLFPSLYCLSFSPALTMPWLCVYVCPREFPQHQFALTPISTPLSQWCTLLTERPRPLLSFPTPMSDALFLFQHPIRASVAPPGFYFNDFPAQNTSPAPPEALHTATLPLGLRQPMRGSPPPTVFEPHPPLSFLFSLPSSNPGSAPLATKGFRVYVCRREFPQHQFALTPISTPLSQWRTTLTERPRLLLSFP
jgi:hypothetical protein